MRNGNISHLLSHLFRKVPAYFRDNRFPVKYTGHLRSCMASRSHRILLEQCSFIWIQLRNILEFLLLARHRIIDTVVQLHELIGLEAAHRDADVL